MRIQSFRHINTSIADPVQHPNWQGRLERSEDMSSRHSTHWWGTSQELRSRVPGQSHPLRRAYQEIEVVHIQAGTWYQQSTIYNQEDSGTQMFTRSDGSSSGSCHQETSRPQFPLTTVPLLTVLLLWDDGQDRECDRIYKIIGPQQTRPVNFNDALKSP